jgi:hypothetical protein
MEGADLLDYIPTGSKWGTLNNLQQSVVLITLLSTICVALESIKLLFIDIIIPSLSFVNDMTQYVLIFRLLWEFGFDIILILVFSLITVQLVQKAQNKTKIVENEQLELINLCERLYQQVRKDHSNLMNIIWDINKESNKLKFANQLDALIYETQQKLKEYNKMENGK